MHYYSANPASEKRPACSGLGNSEHAQLQVSRVQLAVGKDCHRRSGNSPEQFAPRLHAAREDGVDDDPTGSYTDTKTAPVTGKAPDDQRKKGLDISYTNHPGFFASEGGYQRGERK